MITNNKEFLNKYSIQIPEQLFYVLQLRRVNHPSVITCSSICDHNVPYIVANIPTNKYQSRFKNIKILKNLKTNEFISDFTLIPFSKVYGFDKINDQLYTLNRCTA